MPESRANTRLGVEQIDPRASSPPGSRSNAADRARSDQVSPDFEPRIEIDLRDPQTGSDRVRRLNPMPWADWMPTVSLIIPAKNEAANLPHILPVVPGWVAEVILVDGSSTDATVPVAKQLMPAIRIINQPGKGKGDAMLAGCRAARGDIVAFIDADGSMNPVELHSFVGQLVAGADLVKGSRFNQGAGTKDMEWFRRFGNSGLTLLTRLLFGGRFTDLCYGYFAVWRNTFESLAPEAEGFEIEAAVFAKALRNGLLITEVPSFEARRVHGVSNLRTFPDGWRVLKTLIRERISSRVPAVPTRSLRMSA